jgi:hypothetical protein
MDKAKAIVGSCIFIGLAVMGQTGYAIYHNRMVAEQEQRQREAIVKQAAEALKLARSNAAWNAAVKDLPVQMLIWFIMQQTRTGAPAPTGTTAVKVYEKSDVAWKDPNTVKVSGVLIFTPDERPKSIPTGDIRQYFSWSREVALLDDDTWKVKSGIGGVDINPATVAKPERDAMLTANLRP